MTPAATVPADRVFWCVIDAPGGRVRPGLIPAGLWPSVEDDVPVSAEHLWAIGTPLDESRIAVCAIRRVDLTELANGALSLIPASMPDYITAPADSFNFLIGEYEPTTLRRARLRRHIVAAACTLLAAGLVAVGLSRRAGALNAEAIASRTAAYEMIASMATRPIWSRDDFALELMQRRQTVHAELTPPEDAAQALAALLARWPTQVPGKPQAISASGTAASIAVTIPGDPQSFLAALKAPEGWTLAEPRLVAIDRAMRLNLELHKEGTR